MKQPTEARPWAGLAVGLLALAAVQSSFSFTRRGQELSTDGSQPDVQAAISNANPGDVVKIPPGSFIWGTNASFVKVDVPIILQGAGTNLTTIECAVNAGKYANAVIRITTNATVKGLTYKGLGINTSAFSAGPANGWRITEVVYYANSNTAYFAFVTGYGLIDHCTINGVKGTDELIFARGPNDSWYTPSSMGTSNAVYVEDCTFSGPGYVMDNNASGRFVVRFCTITGPMHVDCHMIETSSDGGGVHHGARQTEVYNNRWTYPAGPWLAMEFTSGTGMVFDNASLTAFSSDRPLMMLYEYGSIVATAYWTNKYRTPTHYPIPDQPGMGIYIDGKPGPASAEPWYFWNNRLGISGTAIDWPIAWKIIPQAANDQYFAESGISSFHQTNIVRPDADFFKGVYGGSFDGFSGIGRGTKAQMLSISPAKKGVGFWVTDEADWNQRNPGPDGQLYVWNGTAWILKYTPFRYPYFMPEPTPPGTLQPPSPATH